MPAEEDLCYTPAALGMTGKSQENGQAKNQDDGAKMSSRISKKEVLPVEHRAIAANGTFLFNLEFCEGHGAADR